MDFYQEKNSLLFRKEKTVTQMVFEKDNDKWCSDQNELVNKGAYLTNIVKIQSGDANIENLGSIWIGGYGWWIVAFIILIVKIVLVCKIYSVKNKNLLPWVSLNTSETLSILISVLISQYNLGLTSFGLLLASFIMIIVTAILTCSSGHPFMVFSTKFGMKNLGISLVFLVLTLVFAILFAPLVPYIVSLTTLIPAFEQKKIFYSKNSRMAYIYSALNFFIVFMLWYVSNTLYSPFTRYVQALPSLAICILGFIALKISVGGSKDQDDCKVNIPLENKESEDYFDNGYAKSL